MNGTGTVSLTGNDTIVIGGFNLVDLADGDVGKLTFPNDLANLKTGKNGNSIYALNASGQQAEVELRVIRASRSDKFLQSILQSMVSNFAAFVLLDGQFVKRSGDGQGNISYDTYILSGGIFVRNVDAKENVEGDTEQSISLFRLKFANAPRAIQ